MNRFEADVDRVTELRGQRMTWSMIQIMHGCSKKAMTKWRQRVKFVDPFDDVEDADLDLLVENITADHPLMGYTTIASELHGVYGVAVTCSASARCATPSPAWTPAASKDGAARCCAASWWTP